MVSIKVAQVSRRPVWPVVAVIGLVVVLFIAFSSTNARRSGPPLDGRSTDPDGARAAALLIEQRGRSTGVAEASDLSTGVAIALTSDLDDADWAALKQFAGDGGIVIVATPVSPLWASGSSPELRPSILAGSNCGSTFGSLDDVRRLDVPLVRVFPSAPDGCLRVGDGDLVRSEPVGEGQVISLGVNSIFRNDTIGRADHALLITRLIDSTEGDVRFIEPQAFVGGSKGLLELVPRWVLAAAGCGVGVLCPVAGDPSWPAGAGTAHDSRRSIGVGDRHRASPLQTTDQRLVWASAAPKLVARAEATHRVGRRQHTIVA